jgi:hypothetical protein
MVHHKKALEFRDFFFWWDWGLNSGLCICKAGALQLEPHFQSILVWLFWRRGVAKFEASLFAWAGLELESP